MKKLHPILNLTRRIANQRKNSYNTRKLSPEELMKYRKMINNNDYLNNAISDMADNFIKGLQMGGKKYE